MATDTNTTFPKRTAINAAPSSHRYSASFPSSKVLASCLTFSQGICNTNRLAVLFLFIAVLLAVLNTAHSAEYVNGMSYALFLTRNAIQEESAIRVIFLSVFVRRSICKDLQSRKVPFSSRVGFDWSIPRTDGDSSYE